MRPSRKDTPAFRDASQRQRAAGTYQLGAEEYDRARPFYPDEVICMLPEMGTVLDVGAGTGKFTAQLARAGHRVLACEPAAQMAQVLKRNYPGVPVWQASAEATALGDATVDALTAAQTWHWVDPAAASAEADRVIRPGGKLLLCWNTIDVSHPWVLRLTRIMHSGDVLRRGFYPEVKRPWALEQEKRLTWIQPITPEGLFELMATRSYWLRCTPQLREKMTANLTWYLYDRLGFDPGQLLPLPYRTDAFSYTR
ncbi:class I SAM-dependent methyltransferase [Corynebacterium mayonis]|uniref:class I SAM-dependent methyltransferase n=1 Tax=Corynebacterium mayonis TaxID=3062461 RepID=UPI0031403E2F